METTSTPSTNSTQRCGTIRVCSFPVQMKLQLMAAISYPTWLITEIESPTIQTSISSRDTTQAGCITCLVSTRNSKQDEWIGKLLQQTGIIQTICCILNLRIQVLTT